MGVIGGLPSPVLRDGGIPDFQNFPRNSAKRTLSQLVQLSWFNCFGWCGGSGFAARSSSSLSWRLRCHGNVLSLFAGRLVLHLSVVVLIVIRPLLLVRRRNGSLSKRLAHSGEEAFGLLVLLLLALLRPLEQEPGLPVLGVQLHDLLAILDAVEEVLHAEVGLGAAEGGLDVLGVVLQHGIAGALGLEVLVHLQVACRLVQVAKLLQLLRLRLVLLLEIVHITEHLCHLLVTLQGHHEAPALEEGGPDLLASCSKFQLLVLGHAPRLLDLLKVFEPHSELHLVRRH
mmetsp:Transcript_22403/g.51963  ORF Transcript_22403/g.51963 Transcript_22403/m.51963 type:complete len:286 (+) Transcript_22403:69-926(+)